MGMLKSLLAGADAETEHDSETPDEARRSALDAAIDQLIAERGLKPAPTPGEPVPSGVSMLHTMERRGGPDRRQDTEALAPAAERRTGGERRMPPSAPRTGAFGRRGS